MLCIKPFRRPSFEHGCGQCLPCRINRKRTWAGRILLEALAHQESSFITLTYSEKALPEGNTLSDEHWREFTKGIGYRYFGCGEYGSRLFRPHYHLVVFGLPPLVAEDFALARWPHGFVCARPFSVEHAAYVAAYTVKKLTSVDDPRLAPGQVPEFARMSRRPAIGTLGLRPFQDWLTTREGARYLAEALDVPQVIKAGGKVFPLGRTLVTKLREACDIPSDLPARNERRRDLYKRTGSIPELAALRENKRVASYERQRALSRRSHGVL